ncbi:MAG: translation initiation factor IF-3 [Candidatus Saccharibacteria bacterium]|nr:translation initiation factor IF-3 [Candidatus Saccharibacteria bacterium]
MNQEIRSKNLRVIGVNGEQLGVLTIQEAMKLAKEAGVDLVEISPNTDPPVAKIIDWGKYQYQKMKKQQKNRKNAKASELKQMRFGLKISDNDLQIKLKKTIQFLEKGHKVRLLIVFRGREMAHKELGQEMVEKIMNIIGDRAIIDQKPQLNGRNLSLSIRSK